MISELADLSRGSVSSECETHESVTVSNGPSPVAIQIRGDVNKWRRDMKPAIISRETADELRHDPVGAARFSAAGYPAERPRSKIGTSKAAAIIME